MEPKIQRFPWFDTIDHEGQPRSTVWKYKRAIEGHKFILIEVDFVAESIVSVSDLFGQIYDGHVYSHWGSFPNIFDQATLAMSSLHQYSCNVTKSLHGFECKEFTLSARNTHASSPVRISFIVWFYEVPMSKLETYEYAVKQPRYKYRHGSARTLDRFED